MGAILIALAVGMLIFDQQLAPWYPFLFVFLVGATWASCYELLALLGPSRQPQRWLCYLAVLCLAYSNWEIHAAWERWPDRAGAYGYFLDAEWANIFGRFVILLMAAVIIEMATFREPGRCLERMGLTVFMVCYLGLLPCFFAQLRWVLPTEPNKCTTALALAIFVPKSCDIGAYVTGRLFGSHKMTPVLSPKKTWEGAAGGLVFAIGAAIGIDRVGPAPVLTPSLLFPPPIWEIVFGITVGIAGMLGDLAESLMKRDCQQKDASQAVPGFGGVLDVVDSVIFSAPVSYFWIFGLNKMSVVLDR